MAASTTPAEYSVLAEKFRNDYERLMFLNPSLPRDDSYFKGVTEVEIDISDDYVERCVGMYGRQAMSPQRYLLALYMYDDGVPDDALDYLILSEENMERKVFEEVVSDPDYSNLFYEIRVDVREVQLFTESIARRNNGDSNE